MRYKNVRKVLIHRQKQAVDFSKQAEAGIEKFVYGRFTRLVAVRRFITGWAVFWLLLAFITAWQTISLSGYFQTLKPVPGGIYNEGILGTLTNLNPIYATSGVDTSLSKLIFAGLFTYNSQNQLVGDLASGYTIDPSGTTYTVSLKPGLTWQDGKPLTSADVVYTFDTIQDPDTQSPLYSSWQGIKVSAPNPYSVRFQLPNPLASFPEDLTVGILPQHILGSIEDSNLRAAAFNISNPVGAGPFAWNGLQVSGNTPQNAIEQAALVPFSHYVLGKPKLAEFIVHAYASQSQLVQAFTSGQLNAMAGLDSVPAVLAHDSSVHIDSPLLTAGVYVFFKTNDGVLGDTTVRKALVMGSDPSTIINRLGYPTIPVTEPLLEGQLAYNPQYAEVTNQVAQAKALLSQDGWQPNSTGYRFKANQLLSFNLVTTGTPENRLVSSMLAQQWKALGVKLNIVYESANTYQTTIQDHGYDATLDGISIGTDPDVFVYWDSSQFDPRSSGLNLSEYSNPTVDQALEEGRTRLEPALRVIKYQPFLAAWQQDAPALGLYQPRMLYITHQMVYGFSQHEINSPPDRFSNVQNWEILTANVTDPKNS